MHNWGSSYQKIKFKYREREHNYIHSNATVLTTPALLKGILSTCTITIMSPACIKLTHTTNTHIAFELALIIVLQRPLTNTHNPAHPNRHTQELLHVKYKIQRYKI